MNPITFLWRLRKLAIKPPAPYKLAIRRPATMVARMNMEAAQLVERRVPFDLKELAMGRTASLVGCAW